MYSFVGEKVPMLTLRLADGDHDRLTRLSEERQIPVSTLARSLLVQMMDREEDPALRAKDILETIEKDPKLQFHLRRLVLFVEEGSVTG